MQSVADFLHHRRRCVCRNRDVAPLSGGAGAVHFVVSRAQGFHGGGAEESAARPRATNGVGRSGGRTARRSVSGGFSSSILRLPTSRQPTSAGGCGPARPIAGLVAGGGRASHPAARSVREHGSIEHSHEDGQERRSRRLTRSRKSRSRSSRGSQQTQAADRRGRQGGPRRPRQEGARRRRARPAEYAGVHRLLRAVLRLRTRDR